MKSVYPNELLPTIISSYQATNCMFKSISMPLEIVVYLVQSRQAVCGNVGFAVRSVFSIRLVNSM